MILWTSLIVNLFLTLAICCFLPQPGAALLLFIPIYNCLNVISILFALCFYMCLGRSGPRVVSENKRYDVLYCDDKTFCVSVDDHESGPLPIDFIHETVFVKGLEAPYIETKTYEITGWRRRWLYELYEDYSIVTLYLPSKDET